MEGDTVGESSVFCFGFLFWRIAIVFFDVVKVMTVEKDEGEHNKNKTAMISREYQFTSKTNSLMVFLHFRDSVCFVG